nr:unnamed protein product [Digitaria exilis]
MEEEEEEAGAWWPEAEEDGVVPGCWRSCSRSCWVEHEEAFRILVSNYHSIDDHVTYPEIDELMAEVAVTPALVAETLMRSEDPDIALNDLIELLKSKRDGNNPDEEEAVDGNEDKSDNDDDDDSETDEN